MYRLESFAAARKKVNRNSRNNGYGNTNVDTVHWTWAKKASENCPVLPNTILYWCGTPCSTKAIACPQEREPTRKPYWTANQNESMMLTPLNEPIKISFTTMFLSCRWT